MKRTITHAFRNDLRSMVVSTLLVLVVVSFASAGDRGKIAGRVVDAKTGDGLPGVNVVIIGTTMGASTDMMGDYVIPHIPPGTYTIRASFIGFKDVRIDGLAVNADATTEQNFSLEETILEGEEVVIVADRPLVQKDNTTSRIVLEPVEMKTRPTASLTDVLTTLPSINIEQGEMLIRGRPLGEVAVLVDGMRTRNPVTNTSYLHNVSLHSIQEIEVITGTFDAEYGEAQSGVFKIITKEGGERWDLYAEVRYTPPGKKHWGPALYDYSSTFYWENTHARHLQWWIDNPDQWMDPLGVKGSDANSIWTPEVAYKNYLDTHQPLSDYTNIPTYQFDLSVSGPVPGVKDLSLFVSGSYQSVAPILGNAFRKRGEFFNGTGKIAYALEDAAKLTFSMSYNNTKTSYGVTWPYSIYSLESRYAYYDYDGYPEFQYDSEVVKYTKVFDVNSLLEVQLSRGHTKTSRDILPGDPVGWDASGPQRDNLLAVDEKGNPVIGGYLNIIGYHTLGYFFRYRDNIDEWTLAGKYINQMTKNWEFKAGLDGTYFIIDHFNQAKAPNRTDDNVYRPFKGAAWLHNKLEFGGFILNAGLRLDFYDVNDYAYLDPFNPLEGPKEDSKLYWQLSPRLGVAHPIDELTVLHFSYGQYFQGPQFGDYGELNSSSQGNLTTFLIDGTRIPSALGNRNLRPEKTVAYEIGIDRSFADIFLVQVIAYYKDITNTVRDLTVITPQATYRTSGNGDYADTKGFEISLRKIPSGYFWGYLNYSSRSGIIGRSGDPSTISPTGVTYLPSGDIIEYNNPIVKAGLMAKTPGDGSFISPVLDNIFLYVEYTGVIPNDRILGNLFEVNGKQYLRPVDHYVKMRLTKEFKLFGDLVTMSGYVEVDNLLNFRSINLDLFGLATTEDKLKMAESNFEYTPLADANGVRYLESSKYRNLPRSIVFGLTISL